MTHATSAAAEIGLPATILPFPTDRVRAPFECELYEKRTMDRCFIAASVANQYRILTPGEASAVVANVINERGAEVIAHVLEQNAAAIVTLRAVLASLIEADRRIATAADSILQARGI